MAIKDLKRHQYTKFSIDENQRKNLFDLGVAIVVLIAVILTLSQNVQPKPILPQSDANKVLLRPP
ncbi:MAG: hypothetical protein V7K21_20000 [Nostoc sp.]|uniref:hypothetical protein n=1 Tax=Nostoc sp. TaxID=1180 RepID=UPI002FFC8F75